MPLQKLSLILGGAASGKSAYAEGLVRGSGLARVYLATAEAWDDEMAQRIERHRASRGQGWRIVEVPREVGRALGQARSGEAVLIDCATLWLTNLMMAEMNVGEAEAGLLAALDVCRAPVVVVSNEVGQGIVPDTALGRRFRDAQGGLNRRLAARAGFVAMVTAGLPLALKGAPP